VNRAGPSHSGWRQGGARSENLCMRRYILRDATGTVRPPRIALLVDRFDGRGGAETYTRDLADWLAARGCDVHVIGRTCGPREHQLPVTFHQLPPCRSWTACVHEMRGSIAAIAPDVTHDMGMAVGCDIFHSHVGSPMACQQAADLAHPAWYRVVRQLVQSAVRRRRIATRAAVQFGAAESLCIALSHRGAADLTTLHGVSPGRIRLVPNGVDTERFNPIRHRDAGTTLRRRCGFAPDDVVVIGVAHNHRLKGMPVLARAVLGLRREGLPLKLLLCGGRTASPPTAEAAIVELGCVSDMAACYAAADIAVQPTFYDACSLATLESLASGLPVVTTRANGASELLTPDDAIVLDDAADIATLTATLRRLAADRWLRASLGRAAHRRALDLGVEAAFTSIVAVYGEVVAARGCRLVPVDAAAIRRSVA
jgi:UDP-glucose:(heptosyl)LPS alpha-1,3-glucosyltransferase